MPVATGKDSKGCYVYCHTNPETGIVFYIGKGQRNRLNHRAPRSELWKRYVRKHGFLSEILVDNLTEEEALSLEAQVIKEKRDKGIRLVNFLDEGGGSSRYWLGRKRPDIAKRMRERVVSDETRKRMSETKKGKPFRTKRNIKQFRHYLNGSPAEFQVCELCSRKFLARRDHQRRFCSRACANIRR